MSFSVPAKIAGTLLFYYSTVTIPVSGLNVIV